MGILVKFSGGVLMTLLFVILVPYVTDTYITPYITELVGGNEFLTMGSQTVIQFLIFLVMIVFIMLLGGGAVLRWCGVFGVIGMVVAYYLLGDVTDAFIPLLSLSVAYILTIPWRKRKEEKKKRKEQKNAHSD